MFSCKGARRSSRAAGARLRHAAMVGAALAVQWMAQTASAIVYTWTGQALSAKWDQVSFGVTNWVGNVIPVSSSATQLVFPGFTNQSSADQDIANPFVLNSIAFAGNQSL